MSYNVKKESLCNSSNLVTLLTFFQFVVRFGEGVDGEFQIFARMRSRDLRADPRGAMRHDRIEEANDINAFLQHPRRELLRFSGVADHDRHNRMCAGLDHQAALG